MKQVTGGNPQERLGRKPLWRALLEL